MMFTTSCLNATAFFVFVMMMEGRRKCYGNCQDLAKFIEFVLTSTLNFVCCSRKTVVWYRDFCFRRLSREDETDPS